MKVRNETNLPTELLREIVGFCCPPRVTDFVIRFARSRRGYHAKAWSRGYAVFTADKKRGFRSRAYWEGTGTECSEVLIRIPHYSQSRRKIENKQRGGGGYLPSVEHTREEATVHLVAHELRRLYQALHPDRQRGRAWGARRQFSERDADAYAISRTGHWRRRGSPHFNSDGSVR